MVNIKFEDRAVAFVDVLGFRSIVANAANDAKAMEQLRSLVDLLSSAVPTLDKTVAPSVPKHLVPRHNYISDSIILSAPISDDGVKSYRGLEIVAMRIIQLTHHFLNEGYLIRGGLAVGPVWHTEANIVGPAYQEAYLLEANGDEPCVILSTTAERSLSRGSRMCIRKARGKWSICAARNEPMMVNGLHDFYIPNNTERGAIEQQYEKYSQLVDVNLKSDISKRAKNKWLWFRKYLEAERSSTAKWVGA